MGESFLDKVNTYWSKGWNENPSYARAKNYIDIMAKGNAVKEVSKGKEEIEAEAEEELSL